MLRTVPNGFTLIELLVVMAVMAIVGTWTIANFRSFGEDKALESTALDIQSLLRTAQTNATTNLKCDNQPAAKWMVEFQTDQKNITLNCQDSSGSTITVKNMSLSNSQNISQMQVYEGSNPIRNCEFPSWKVEFDFFPLSAAFSFPSPRPSSSPSPTPSSSPSRLPPAPPTLDNPIPCGADAAKIGITVQDSKTGNIKTLLIEQGGGIYVQ